MTDVAAFAKTFVDDNRNGRDYTLPWADEPPSLTDAYRIQDLVLDGLSAERGPLGGYKVAVTAKAMQDLMGLSEPLGGLIHEGQIHESPWTLSMAAHHTPAVEFEVAIRIGTDVPSDGGPFTAETIARYVDSVMASFEVIDTRGGDLPSLGAVGLVADRCLCAGAVLGGGIDEWSDLDLGACPVALDWNGETVDTATTGAAMGHPFEGLAWVANHLPDRGHALRAGHIVLTGSAFTPRPVSAGDSITYRIDGIGSATIEVGD